LVVETVNICGDEEAAAAFDLDGLQSSALGRRKLSGQARRSQFEFAADENQFGG
jgi:hypothetical protein